MNAPGDEHAHAAAAHAVEDERTERLDGVRAQLDDVSALPVEDRAAVFAAINDAVVSELNAMEEV